MKSPMDGPKDRSPKNEGDPSRKLPKGPSVNADPTRSATAASPKTLGPRTA